MKAFAGDKVNVITKLKSELERVENNVGKRQNVGYQHFFTFFPEIFSKNFFHKVAKS